MFSEIFNSTECVRGLGFLSHLDFKQIISIIVPAIIFFIFIFSLLRQTFRTRNLIKSITRLTNRNPKLCRILNRTGLKEDDVEVFESELSSCFCAGFINPKIYVSSKSLAELSDEELLAVLIHEKQHKASHDPLRAIILRSLERALFFVPLIRFLKERQSINKELAADREVMKLPHGNVLLAKAIYKMTGGEEIETVSHFKNNNLLDIRLAIISGKSVSLKKISFNKIFLSLLAITILAIILVPSTHAEAHIVPLCDKVRDSGTHNLDNIKTDIEYKLLNSSYNIN